VHGNPTNIKLSRPIERNQEKDPFLYIWAFPHAARYASNGTTQTSGKSEPQTIADQNSLPPANPKQPNYRTNSKTQHPFLTWPPELKDEETCKVVYGKIGMKLDGARNELGVNMPVPKI